MILSFILRVIYTHQSLFRCGNVAAILELDEHLQKSFTIFEAAPQVSQSIKPHRRHPQLLVPKLPGCIVFSQHYACIVLQITQNQWKFILHVTKLH